MHGAEGKDRNHLIGEINVIPFIDVCLVLLIIVLMTAAAVGKLVEVKPPRADGGASRDMNLVVTLSIDKEGRFYLEEEQKHVEARNLWLFLKQVQGDVPWSTLVLRADRDTPHEFLALAIQCAQSLGIEDIAIAVEEKREG